MVNAPLRVGPSTEETPKIAPAIPCILGRCSSGTQNTKTTIWSRRCQHLAENTILECRTHHSGKNSSSSHSSNRSANNERNRVRSRSADSRANYEHQDGTQKSRLDRNELVQLSEKQLKCRVGKQVGCAIPTDVVWRFEVVRDLRDGCADDEFVLLTKSVCHSFHGLSKVVDATYQRHHEYTQVKGCH